MIVVRWIVGAIVALACIGAVVLDFTAEHRPKGGWIYVCQLTRSVSNGTLVVRRTINDHGEGQDHAAMIVWTADDIVDPEFSVQLSWLFAFPGRDMTTMRARIILQMKRDSPKYDNRKFRINRVADHGGPTVESEMPGTTGYFDMAKVSALSRIGEPLVWTFGKSSDEYERLGSLSVAQLREAAAAMPAVKRRLDAVTPHYATMCKRTRDGVRL